MLQGKSWEDLTKGEVLRDYYFDIAIELEELRNATGEVDMDRIEDLERRLTGEEKSDGPTGDKWIDEFMAGGDDEVEAVDDDYFTWKAGD